MIAVAKIATDHLSHSQVQTFTLCPRKWHYDKVEHASKERISAALVFGCAVHDALAAVNEVSLQGQKINASDAFIKAWKASIAVDLPVHYGKDSADELLEKGKALVTAYEPPKGIIGVEQPIQVTFDGLPPIEGRIDIIRKEGDDLVLVDLKTSGTKVLSDTHAVESQLGLYGIAYPARKSEIIVLAKLKTPVISIQEITPWSRDHVHRHYKEVYHAMKNNVRFANRGWQCESCSFCNRCKQEDA